MASSPGRGEGSAEDSPRGRPCPRRTAPLSRAGFMQGRPSNPESRRRDKQDRRNRHPKVHGRATLAFVFFSLRVPPRPDCDRAAIGEAGRRGRSRTKEPRTRPCGPRRLPPHLWVRAVRAVATIGFEILRSTEICPEISSGETASSAIDDRRRRACTADPAGPGPSSSAKLSAAAGGGRGESRTNAPRTPPLVPAATSSYLDSAVRAVATTGFQILVARRSPLKERPGRGQSSAAERMRKPGTRPPHPNFWSSDPHRPGGGGAVPSELRMRSSRRSEHLRFRAFETLRRRNAQSDRHQTLQAIASVGSASDARAN